VNEMQKKDKKTFSLYVFVLEYVLDMVIFVMIRLSRGRIKRRLSANRRICINPISNMPLCISRKKGAD